MDRFNAYKKALKKARDMYSEIPQEYQRMLMPLAIFHDVGSLSVEGDSHWRGKGIPELDYYLEARDWLHHAIGAGIVLRLDGILPQDVDLLATLIFHHGAIANVGVDFFKSDILNKFDQHLQKLFLTFLLMDMSGRQDGNNAVNEKFIDAFIKKVESLSKQTDAIFVAERISKGFGMLAIDIETRFKWLMAVKSYFQLSGRYKDFIRNWKRVRVNQFEFFIRIAKKSPQIYAQMLAQISDALGDYLRDDDDVFIETDIDFLGLPFGQGKDQQRNQWIEMVYERINAGRPLLFKIKENPVLDFHLSDKNNPLKFSIKERKAYVFEIQLKQMKEEENKRKVYPSVDSGEDRASVVTEELQITGGVDLTQQEVSIQRKNSLQSLPFNFNSTIRQQLENLIGLSPVIINIHPMTVTVLEFMDR